MIGNYDIRLVINKLLRCFSDKFIAEARRCEDASAPGSYEEVGEFVVLFPDGKQVYRQEKQEEKHRGYEYNPQAPEIVEYCRHSAKVNNTAECEF